MRTLRDEVIAESVEIVESANVSLKGLKGKIVDETRNTLKLLVGKNIKTVMKKGNIFMISGKKIDGADLVKRPEERVKIRA